MYLRNILIAALTLSLLMVVGCQKNDDSQTQANTTGQEYSKEQKKEMVEKAQGRLEEMEKKGEKLKQDLDEQESETFANQWDNMIGDAKTQLNKLQTYTAEGWSSAFTGFQETITALNEIYQKNKLLLSEQEMKVPQIDNN